MNVVFASRWVAVVVMNENTKFIKKKKKIGIALICISFFGGLGMSKFNLVKY